MKKVVMGKKTQVCLAAVLALWPASFFCQESLLPEHREWLENVGPIMTTAEKEVFLQLKTSADRRKFVHFFWKQRDPLPDTEVNEFQKEYLERVRFADTHFGHGTPRRGSQTERGFFYLALGPPQERQRYTTHSQILPLELWSYRGQEQYGLPPHFYLIFYQPQGLGEFRLFHPGLEGPEKLVIPSWSRQAVTRSTAYQLVKEVSAELAAASLSYLPGDRPLGLASFSSDALVASIRSLAGKKYSDLYARRYLRYKDYVETEHTDVFIPCHVLVRVFRQSDTYYLHWMVEPGRLSFAERDSTYQASFELILRMEDAGGRPILESQQEIPLMITPEQFRRNQDRPFAFQDILPVIPGESTLFFLLKNKTGRDFTSFEAKVNVPQDQGPPVLSGLLLYRSLEEKTASDKDHLKAFFLEGNQYFFNARHEFSPQASMGVYVQLFRFEPLADETANTLLEVKSHDTGQVVVSRVMPLAEVLPPGRQGIDFGLLPLEGLKPGYYQVVVSVLDTAGRSLLAGGENFVLLARAVRDLPWIYSRQHPSPPSAWHSYLLGSQFFLSGRLEKARDLLEESLRLEDAPATRLLLAKALYGLGQFRVSLDLAAPLFEETRDREAGKVTALCHAGLKQWTPALAALQALMAGATEIGVLNLAAECHMNLNQPEEALVLLEKSLSLDPDQAWVREMAARARALVKKDKLTS